MVAKRQAKMINGEEHVTQAGMFYSLHLSR